MLTEIQCMDECKNYRKSAKDAHKQANQAAKSSRQHSNDLGQMIRSAKDAREVLTDGRNRQRKREQNPHRNSTTKHFLKN